MGVEVLESVKCFHCGQHCDEVIFSNDKPFCCVGCKSVFESLNENNLCEYYALEKNSGVSQQNAFSTSFAYLDEPQVRQEEIIKKKDEKHSEPVGTVKKV